MEDVRESRALDDITAPKEGLGAIDRSIDVASTDKEKKNDWEKFLEPPYMPAQVRTVFMNLSFYMTLIPFLPFSNEFKDVSLPPLRLQIKGFNRKLIGTILIFLVLVFLKKILAFLIYKMIIYKKYTYLING